MYPLGFISLSCRQLSQLTHCFKSNFINVVEVGPRDGLQNEKSVIPTSIKIELVNKLSDAGLKHIEVTSFVSPSWVPQLADASRVLSQIIRKPGVIYSALVPNEKGFEKAKLANLGAIAIFTAASDAFSTKNINCSISESLLRFKKVVTLAKMDNIPVRGYVSCVVGCPYQGFVSPDSVAHVSESLLELGCYEVSLGDTIGCGIPETVDAMLRAVLRVCSPNQLAVHMHNTKGYALENIDVAVIEHGIRTVDSAVGGLGGCPYAGPGASGNVATEEVVRWFSGVKPNLADNRMSSLVSRGLFETGLNSDKLSQVNIV